VNENPKPDEKTVPMIERFIAVIPARGGSKGIPKKNLALVAGKPMLWYSLEAARTSNNLAAVVVSTEDREIATYARREGAEVVERPCELACDRTPTEPVLCHAVEQWEAIHRQTIDNVVLLQPTSPIRQRGAVDRAIERFQLAQADSLVSVCEEHSFFWKIEKGIPMPSYDYRNRPRRQDITAPYYRENGSIYITRKNVLMEEQSRLGGVVELFPMSQEESIEVDTQVDLMICHSILGLPQWKSQEGVWKNRMRNIKLVAMDVDGVLTDGSVFVDEEGRETRKFSVIDGHGIGMLRERGIPVAFITREQNPVAEHRSRKLGISYFLSGVLNKATAVKQLAEQQGLSLEQVLYIGDDLPDIPVLQRVGCAVAVADACQEALAHAHYVTAQRGGAGAVREVIDHLLEVWDAD
jgi:YrbI family 3-deoxy-D-manno-octulosonate 8-phosphate phosphatase